MSNDKPSAPAANTPVRQPVQNTRPADLAGRYAKDHALPKKSGK